MSKAENFHKALQARRDVLEEIPEDKSTVAERYELSIIDALDGFYDDEEDIKNMGIALDHLVNHIFMPFMPNYAVNT